MVNDAELTMRIISKGNLLFYVLEQAKAIEGALGPMIKGAFAV
jgi:hypothetical protein